MSGAPSFPLPTSKEQDPSGRAVLNLGGTSLALLNIDIQLSRGSSGSHMLFMFSLFYDRHWHAFITKSCPTLVTLWTVACQAPLFVGFSRQEYSSGLTFPSLGIFPTQGLNLGLLHCWKILNRVSYEGWHLNRRVLRNHLPVVAMWIWQYFWGRLAPHWPGSPFWSWGSKSGPLILDLFLKLFPALRVLLSQSSWCSGCSVVSQVGCSLGLWDSLPCPWLAESHGWPVGCPQVVTVLDWRVLPTSNLTVPSGM